MGFDVLTAITETRMRASKFFEEEWCIRRYETVRGSGSLRDVVGKGVNVKAPVARSERAVGNGLYRDL